MTITACRGSELTAAELYEIWRIRDAVFAVEQQCDEPDVDDVDLRDDCAHLWIASADGLLRSYLRTYLVGGSRSIGRVATRREDRSLGLAGALVREVIVRWGGDELTLNAQSQLEDWYASFGFIVTGPHFVEAGIDHVPMARPSARELT